MTEVADLEIAKVVDDPSPNEGDTVTYTVTYQAPSSGTLTNIGAAASSVMDPTSANNRSSVETFVGPVADLEVTKTGPATGSDGETITYTVEVVNLGPDAGTDVVITDTLPGTGTFVSASDGGTESGGVVTWPTIGTMAASPPICCFNDKAISLVTSVYCSVPATPKSIRKNSSVHHSTSCSM